jgi:hypothetical protein
MNDPRTTQQDRQADSRARPREQRLTAAVVSQYLHRLAGPWRERRRQARADSLP